MSAPDVVVVTSLLHSLSAGACRRQRKLRTRIHLVVTVRLAASTLIASSEARAGSSYRERHVRSNGLTDLFVAQVNKGAMHFRECGSALKVAVHGRVLNVGTCRR